MSDKDPTIQEVKEAVGDLQTMVESKAGINQETLDNINKTLDAHEEQNQKLITELKSSEDRETEHKERMDALEVELARAGNTGKKDNYKEQPEYKALNQMAKMGIEVLEQEHKASLRTDNDTSGGYLVPVEMDNLITKKIVEISAIRSIARVRTIAGKSLEMPIRNTIPVATYEGEADTGGDSQSSYDNETITAFRQTFSTGITKDMLMDAAFDMESEMLGDAADAFAKGEGNGHVVGTGNKTPEGFLVNAAVGASARTTTTSATIDPEDVILITSDLKVGYEPVYVMNRSTLAFLRTLKSTTGSFLWQPGMNGPVANTLNGFPYLIAQDMPDIAANSLSIAFGDFRRGYTIVDRTGMSVIRDELTLKKQAIVEFTFNRWNTGQVTLPEAIKVLKTKA